MRKNVKKQLALRVLSTAALMAMVSSIATAAFADTYDLNTGSVTVETRDDGITYVTQKDAEINEHPDTTGVTITSNGTQTSNTITVETADKQTTNVTLQDVNIAVDTVDTKSGAIEIKGDGKTNLELNGNNTVLVQNNWSEEHAAIEKADKYGHGTLTITDEVTDNGKPTTGTKADTTGTLVAGCYHEAAAIGGGEGEFADTSNITITGGKITASGGTYGAGIGGGYTGDASNIRIEGNADVIAFGNSGAAIGSGYHSRVNSDITITDHATVTAASLDGCGIGGGQDASGKVTITISGNASVNAQTRNPPAAIGSDRSSATVNIEDHADVTAVGSGVAIGTGYSEGTSTVINITGGTVNAVTRDDSRPAIGTVGGNLDLTINSSTGKTTVNTYTTSSDPLSLNLSLIHISDPTRH